MNAMTEMSKYRHEKVLFVNNEKAGLKAIIAVHNTNLGPAIGGCRLFPYASYDDALFDVLRLSRGMSHKNAVAGLPHGGGKGVIIAETREDAKEAVRSMMEDKVFGDSGNQVVVEEFLTGPEVSVLSFTDGKTLVPMVSSMDHKRALDGDKGLNTGGMGTVAPNPYYTEEVAKECMETIFLPTVEAMNAEGRSFSGCLYFGLMLTPKGPKVIEYNCRFGDPETQVVLPLLESDLLDIMLHISDKTLKDADVRFSDGSACCVVMASNGYPQKYESGFDLVIDKTVEDTVYVAGAKSVEGVLKTAGGRVLGVTATADTLPEALEKAYKKVNYVKFENAYYRKDIGKTFEVLVEGFSKRSKEQLFGRTQQNKVVVFDRGECKIGDLVNVKVTSVTAATLLGELVK